MQSPHVCLCFVYLLYVAWAHLSKATLTWLSMK